MEVSEKLLRQLVQLSQNKRAALSVYLNLHEGRSLIKSFIDKESAKIITLLNYQEKKYFELALSNLFNYLKKIEPKTSRKPGLAFFADLGADYNQDVELVNVPESLLAVDDEVIVYPLALQLPEYEPIGVIVSNTSCARILITAGKKLAEMENFYNKILYLSKAGGWSQIRYQHRRDKGLQNFSKVIIDKAMTIFNELRVKRILIVGRDIMIADLKMQFPKTWADMVIATIPWNVEATDDEFIRKIRPVFEVEDRDYEKNLFEHFVAELKRGGLAHVGLESTLTALKTGQVDTVFISRGVDIETSNILINLAKTMAAFVEFVPEENKTLVRMGSVAALLRYK